MQQLPGLAYAKNSGGADIETKIAVEKSLEERLKNILIKIIGSDKLLVLISAQLYSESDIPSEKEAEDNIILPGMPVKDTLAKMEMNAMDTATMVKNLRATIILDKGVSEEMIKIVEESARGILGIDENRGDQLIIQKMNFQTNPFYWSDVLKPPHLWSMLAIIAAFFFVIGALLFLFGPFRNILKNIAEKSGQSDISAGPAFEGLLQSSPLQAGSDVQGDKKERRFYFLESFRDKPKLKHILSALSAEDIAIALSYLSPLSSGEYLDLIDIGKRAQVIKMLASIKEVASERVEELEKTLKAKIEFTVGGESYIEELLAVLDESSQKAILSDIERDNPKLAGILKDSLVSPADIIKLGKESIYSFYQHIGVKSFSSLLAMLADAEQAELLAMLPEGLAERIRQEIELSGDMSTEKKTQLLRSTMPYLKQLLGR